MSDTRFGWCMSGHHSDCIVEFERFYHGTKRAGRKTVSAVIYTGDIIKCGCKCHKPKSTRKGRTS